MAHGTRKFLRTHSETIVYDCNKRFVVREEANTNIGRTGRYAVINEVSNSGLK